MEDQIVCSGGCEKETQEIHRSVVLSSPVFTGESVTVDSLASFLTREAQEDLAEADDPNEEDPRLVAREFKIKVTFVKDLVTIEKPTAFEGSHDEALEAGWEEDEGNYLCPGCLGKTDATLVGGAMLEPAGAADMYVGEDDDQDDGELAGGQDLVQADDEAEE